MQHAEMQNKINSVKFAADLTTDLTDTSAMKGR